MSLLIILKFFCAFFHCYHHWHGMKCVQIRSYFWSIFFCIQSEYRKIRTWSNSVFVHFSRNVAEKGKCTWPGPFEWNNLVFLSLDGCLRKKTKTKQKKHRLQKVGMNFILFYSTFLEASYIEITWTGLKWKMYLCDFLKNSISIYCWLTCFPYKCKVKKISHFQQFEYF